MTEAVAEVPVRDTPSHRLKVLRDAARALDEDIGGGDLSAALLPPGRSGQAQLLARQGFVLAGCDWFDACFQALDASARIHWKHAEGARIDAGAVVCQVEASAQCLLSGERSAINFLQTLSATATVTAEYVQLLQGSRTRLLDTRKTLPGLRYAQKYAVRVGGGCNHRMGLWDAILIKENHIAAAGSIATAVAAARASAPHAMVEVEVESLDQFQQALQARPDRIMLDELGDADMEAAVAMRPPGIELEISGGIDRERLRQMGRLGIDYVSVGALTKHIQAIDLSLRWI